jgi:hypothetical protein
MISTPIFLEKKNIKLASAARNSTEAQSALAMIRDQGPTVM